jgi:hypothetical protein
VERHRRDLERQRDEDEVLAQEEQGALPALFTLAAMPA